MSYIQDDKLIRTMNKVDSHGDIYGYIDRVIITKEEFILCCKEWLGIELVAEKVKDHLKDLNEDTQYDIEYISNKETNYEEEISNILFSDDLFGALLDKKDKE